MIHSKSLLLVLFLVAVHFASGQRKSLLSPAEEYAVSGSNAPVLYRQAEQLVKRMDADSLYKANRMLIALNAWDSIAYSDIVLEPLLDKIAQLARLNYILDLMGSWDWKWSGTNWGTSSDAATCNCSKRIDWNETTARFYSNDSLVRVSNYLLVRSNYPGSLMRTQYNIVFEDNKEEWRFHVYKPGKYNPYVNYSTNMSLKITLGPLCSCGCGEDIYERIVPGCETISKSITSL